MSSTDGNTDGNTGGDTGGDTGRNFLRAAVARLAAAGIEAPDDDAMALMAHALGDAVPRHALLDALNRPIGPDAGARLEAALAARERRQPMAQIRGWRAFWKHRFRVTPDTLDPRPDTEALVAEALRAPFANILDLGTGTGCILLSLLAERPTAHGLGIDISDKALKVARENARDLGLSDRVHFARGDWMRGLRGHYDLIVSNPPYIALAEMGGLAPEVRNHEPHLALTDGADGLTAYRIIVATAPFCLKPQGRLLVEIGPSQGQAVADLFTKAGFAGLRILPDLDGRDRVFTGFWPG